MSITIGVRIVHDADHPLTDLDSEEREWVRSGTHAVYGIVAVRRCECCGEAHDGQASVWAVVAEETTLAGHTVWDLAEIADEWLRIFAEDVIAEDRAAAGQPDGMVAL